MHPIIPKFRCVIHGSFGKHFSEIRRAMDLFEAAGIEVLAPKKADLVTSKDGFALFEDEADMDPRMVELVYLHHLKRLGEGGFSYFVNPEGYIGKSASYELGIAQVTNVPCFFMDRPADHPAYVHHNSIWSPNRLAEFVVTRGRLPEPLTHPDEANIHRMWEDLMVPGSVIATGGIIEYDSGKAERPILLVQTHKWGGRWSVVGGKLRRNERLTEALAREIKEETGLDSKVGRHLCTFDQIKNSGYYRSGTQHVFVDYVSQVDSKQVQLNDEAQDYLWVPAKEALRTLDIEPNAKHIVELYATMA